VVRRRGTLTLHRLVGCRELTRTARLYRWARVCEGRPGFYPCSGRRPAVKDRFGHVANTDKPKRGGLGCA
jgi:hypothetical protein